VADFGDEAVTLALDGLHEARVVRVIPENLTDFPNGGIDAVFGVHKDFFSPEALFDFLAADETAIRFGQQQQKFHGNFFKLERVTFAAEFIAEAIKLEVREFEER